MNRIQGKTVIITGAANGLGKAAAELLAAEGGNIVLTDIDVANGERTVAAIRASGGSALFVRHDVTQTGQWEQVFEMATRNFATPDVLVNNAGGGTYNDIETTSLEEWRRILAINLDATFIGTQMAIRAMKAARRGSIVNMSSVAALIGSPNLAAYGAAKAGIQTLSKSAAVYCGQKGYNIRVNSIHPGLIETQAGIEMARLATGAASDEAALAQFRMLHPIGRLGVPNDIAQGILYLASDESSFMTGASLVIDGGFTAI